MSESKEIMLLERRMNYVRKDIHPYTEYLEHCKEIGIEPKEKYSVGYNMWIYRCHKEDLDELIEELKNYSETSKHGFYVVKCDFDLFNGKNYVKKVFCNIGDAITSAISSNDYDFEYYDVMITYYNGVIVISCFCKDGINAITIQRLSKYGERMLCGKENLDCDYWDKYINKKSSFKKIELEKWLYN